MKCAQARIWRETYGAYSPRFMHTSSLHTLDVDSFFCNSNGNNYLTKLLKHVFGNRNWECSPAGRGRSMRIAKNIKVIVVMH